MNNIYRQFFLLFLVSMSPLLSVFDAPIDVVYTWVNGQDQDWQSLRDHWMAEEPVIVNKSTIPSRFRDRGELRYSLRSINKFAPFVRKIFIVTNGQVPQWLQEHPKVQIVTHKEIFSNVKFLPTFNSMAIECNLHRIPGLSEHYVYFNDDVFLGRTVTLDDFFTEDGRMKLFFNKKEIPNGLPEKEDSGFIAASKNTNLLLNGVYTHKTRRHHCHTAYPLIKSVVEKIEKQFYAIFQLVASHKFRSINDYTITNGLIPYAAFQMGHAKKCSTKHMSVAFGRQPEKDNEHLLEVINKKPIFFCVQDAANEVSDDHLKLLTTFFETYYPEPAPWEKIDL